MLIYFAAPLFCQAERAFNLKLTGKLEEHGFAVFLPQRDGIESSVPPYDKMTNDERRQAIFAIDRDKILQADVFLFVLDGRVPDEGACVEVGIAYAQKHLQGRGKLLVGLLTDSRAAFLEAKLNPMVQGALDTIAEDENELIAALETYSHTWAEEMAALNKMKK